MAKAEIEPAVRLDLNNPAFPGNLLTLQETERLAALDTLGRLRQMTWNQVHRDKSLRWEKILGVRPPAGVDAIYSLRITQSRRATAYRDGDFVRLLTVATDHDSTCGRK